MTAAVHESNAFLAAKSERTARELGVFPAE